MALDILRVEAEVADPKEEILVELKLFEVLVLEEIHFPEMNSMACWMFFEMRHVKRWQSQLEKALETASSSSRRLLRVSAPCEEQSTCAKRLQYQLFFSSSSRWTSATCVPQVPRQQGDNSFTDSDPDQAVPERTRDGRLFEVVSSARRHLLDAADSMSRMFHSTMGQRAAHLRRHVPGSAPAVF